MTDIIERLRSIKTHGIDQRALKREAADEIERLRNEWRPQASKRLLGRVAEERERCAKVVDDMLDCNPERIAAAIRNQP